MPDFDLTGELSLKIELHMLRPITEKVHSGNGSVSLVSSGFLYCDGNLIGTKFAHTYFKRWPLDDHDDCILVVQTYKKLHIVICG